MKAGCLNLGLLRLKSKHGEIMAITYATKTLAAIDQCLQEDQGAAYRQMFQKVMPHIGDAYRGKDEGFRSHLGSSMIGKECARQIWYGFRWAVKANFGARIVRLFHRGHSEEARFISLLQIIGVQVFQQDAEGNQFRISDVGGHFGGSGDGVGLGVPDVPSNDPCLLEFKTHGDKSFIKLSKDGLQSSKPEHYVQMQTYMRKMQINYGLYMAVNKNDDALYAEIIKVDLILADQFLDRARQIIMLRTAPDRLNNASPGLFACRYCDMKGVCFDNEDPVVNCRTCHYSEALEDGTWHCRKHKSVLDKAIQLTGCSDYIKF